jgi:hypothetical protein
MDKTWGKRYKKPKHLLKSNSLLVDAFESNFPSRQSWKNNLNKLRERVKSDGG